MHVLLRFWPVLLLLAALIAAWSGGLPQHFGWDSLAHHQTELAGWAATHPFGAPMLYVGLYAASVAVSLPESAILTVAGGLLFGTLIGGSLAVLGSTAGAVALFLAVRYHLADALAARAGRFAEPLRRGIERDGFLYLLAIRLVPLFPFWLVNLAAALCGMRLLPFVAATLIGIVPATMIYASIGAGLGAILADGGHPDLSTVFSPRVLLPLLALAALSLLPVAWRHLRRTDG